jgi:hypothetical protein
MWVRFNTAIALFIVVLTAAVAISAEGAVVVIGDLADQTIRNDGIRANTATGRLGASTSGGPAAQGGRSAVFVFRLPQPPAGQPAIVLAADLQFTVVTDLKSGDYNIDLYGLGARSTSAVLSTDYFAGDRDASDATLIRDNILAKPPPDRGTGIISSATTAMAAAAAATDGVDPLVDYLNTQYRADGSGAGLYVFLRLNPDIVLPIENSGVDVAFADNTTGKPQLTISYVPEPGAGLVITVVTSAPLLCRGRRGRRDSLRHNFDTLRPFRGTE